MTIHIALGRTETGELGVSLTGVPEVLTTADVRQLIGLLSTAAMSADDRNTTERRIHPNAIRPLYGHDAWRRTLRLVTDDMETAL
ncbi:hypothetical protein SEA_TESLA_111 [Mycobacterium phage Tesla]|uniref:Uncharacterized protein n=1 Tax=Mycobacterium phage Tesla TaxID=2079425 RepID=A0A2L1J095_9CAUD|nr:hypothetical protein SEA_TESLA_111 [Mycobacterium phage Tesla]